MMLRLSLRRRAVMTVLTTGAVVLSSCNGGGAGTTSVGAMSDKELTYGMAPPSQNGTLEYQPDVVIVGGGAASIKSAGVDGVSWLIDGRAAHAADIVEGKVLFLTTRAVGRVLKVERRGADIAIVLGPFDITEVIRNGHISVHQKVAVRDMITHTRPNAPDAVGVPTPGATSATSPSACGMTPAIMLRTVHLVLAAQPVDGKPPTDGYCAAGLDCKLPPAKVAHSAKIELHPWIFEAEAEQNEHETEVNTTIGYKSNGVEMLATVGVAFENLSVDADANIQEGKMTSAHAHLEGLKRAHVKLESGSESGLSGNVKARLVVPIDFDIPVPGAPFNFTFGFKAIIQTAYSSKDSTISGESEMTFDGTPVGFDQSADGKMVVRDGGAKVTKEPADNVDGKGVGVTGFVLAAQLKVLFGLGSEVLSAGPFAAVTVSVGLTNGSNIGIVKCHQASVDVVLAGGAGFKIEPKLLDVLDYLGVHNMWKTESTLAQVSKSVFHAVQVRPKMAICGA